MWGVYTHLLKDDYIESVLLGFFSPKRFLVSWVLCESIRQQWQAGLSALPVGIVGKYLQQMTWTANDIYGEPCCPSKHSRCGAPATAVRSRARAPRRALGSPHEMKPLLTQAPWALGEFDACCAAHTEERGDTGCKRTCCTACLWYVLSAASSTGVQ